MKKNNLIVFATYWNEKDWVEASLKQIEKLNPKEVIICDGCFDSKKKNRSSDGTFEIIKKWVLKDQSRHLISAVRVSRFKAFFMILKGHNKIPWYYMFSLARLRALYLTLIFNMYRVNQALTFQKMISLSKKWEVGVWTTNVDCDQFYLDSMIENFFKYINSDNDFGLLEGIENTFFENFEDFTNEYERRTYNNMPHKIYKGTNFMPTRATIIEDFDFRLKFKKKFKADFYINKVNSVNVGFYNHYKFKFDRERFKLGYNLGDRKMPNIKNYFFKKYTFAHPKVILKENFLERFRK